MDIVIGHTNSDLDCLGSLALARALYPNAVLVRSRLLHPVVKKLVHLYADHLRLLKLSQIKHEPVEKIVLVDTRSRDRVREYFDALPSLKDFSGTIEIWDHHPKESLDFPNSVEHLCNYGANVSLLAREIISRNLSITPEDATIALIGLYADTGNFTHTNTCTEDFEAAAFFKRMGASLELVNKFIHSMSDQQQVQLFHTMINHLEPRVIRGHHMLFITLFLEEQISGLAAIVEKIQDVESPDATFALFSFKDSSSILLIARSRKEEIPVHHIVSSFGGNGHLMAASALIHQANIEDIRIQLFQSIEDQVRSGLTAEDLMSRNIKTLHPKLSLFEASLFLEKIGHTGAPVVDQNRRLIGILTLRDIQKGRKANAMNAPVKAYMATHPIFVQNNASLREIEEIIFRKNIGHLPVVHQSQVVGIITRVDLLDILEHHRKKQAIAFQNLTSAGIAPIGTPNLVSAHLNPQIVLSKSIFPK